MGRHRDRLEIIADILFVASKGARKTRIMRQARLSYTLLCRYLAEAVKADFVYYENRNYILTGRGERFLDKFNAYSQHCERLNDHLNKVSSERIELEKMCSI